MTETAAPRWATEFDPSYAVPAEITAAGLPDVSWHNDACPAFGASEHDTDWVLWVEHPDPDRRELDGGRFQVTSATGDDVRYDGDSATGALACWRELTAA